MYGWRSPRSVASEQGLQSLDGVGVDEGLIELVHQIRELRLFLREFQARIGANLAEVGPAGGHAALELSLIHISEPTRPY